MLKVLGCLTIIDDSESGSDDDELPLSHLVNICNTLGEIGVTLEEVVAVDNNVVVTETRSDDDIVNSLLNKDTDGENSESDDDPVLNDVPTNADGLLALDTVCRTLETYDNVDEIFFKYLKTKIENIFTKKHQHLSVRGVRQRA